MLDPISSLSDKEETVYPTIFINVARNVFH